MAVLKNRAKMSTSTTGAGTITLGSALSGYQSFTAAGLTTGAITRYTIQDGVNWEIGLGTYTTSGTTLTRTPSESSSGGSAISLSGNAEVFITAAAEDVSPLYDANFVTQTTSSFNGPSATGTDAIAIGLDALASGTRSVGIGALATGTNVGAIASGNGAVALGGSNASGTEAFSANNSRNDATFGSTGANSVTLGYQSRAQATYSIAIGYAAIAAGQYGIALGFSRANGDQSFSIGQNASTASGANTIVIGKAISSSVADQIAIGGTGNTIKLFDAYTLPTTDGSAGTALVTNGSGALSFSSVGADLYAVNPVSATDPVVNGNNSIAIGSAAVAGSATGNNDKIAIGTGATAGNNQRVLALGYYAAAGASGQSATAVGSLAVASGPHATAIGSGTDATATSATALGYNAQAVGSSEAIAIGNSYAGAAGSFAAAIGNNASSYGATGTTTVAIGYQAKANTSNALALGRGAHSTGVNSVTVGRDTDATATSSTALGHGAQATHDNGTAIGASAATTATNQVALGASGHAVKVSGAYTLPTADGSAGTALVTNGSGALSFSAIGTTTTTAGESATTRYIPFVDSSTGTSNETVRVDPALSFINNSSAFTGDQKLTVGQGSASVPVTIMLDGNNNGGNYTPELLFKDGDTSAGLEQKMGRITFQSADTGANGLARIEANVKGGQDPNDGARIIFSTTNDSGTYAERLRITEGGALQVGTAYTLPTADGSSGTALVTNGSGALSFATVGAALYAANESSPSAQPSATGANAVAIGDSAAASGPDALAIGQDTTASGNYATALGSNGDGTGATASGNGGLAIHGSTASGPNSIAIGDVSVSSATASIAIGGGTDATANYNVALGFGAQALTGTSAVAIGNSRASGEASFAANITNSTSSYGAQGTSSIAMGYQSKSTGNYAVAIGSAQATGSDYGVSIGYNARSASHSTVAIGREAGLAGSGSSSISIGHEASSSGSESLAIGRNVVANASRSVAIGAYARVGGIIGKYAFANDYINSSGDAQQGKYVLHVSTTNATAIALTSTGTTASGTNQVNLQNNSAYAFHGTIVAREAASSGTECAAWKVEGLIRREANAGTTVLVNSATTVLDNTPNWGMALSANTSLGCLKIEVTGAAKTIRWVATIHTSEVTYA